MSINNLTQHEQYLKSLEQSLKEIGDFHQKVHGYLCIMQENVQLARTFVDQSWCQVMMLFVLTDQLRSTCLDLREQD